MANDRTHYTRNMSESAGRYIEGTIPDSVDPRIRRPWWLVHCQADPRSSSLSIDTLADDVSSVQIGRALLFRIVPASPLIRLILGYTALSFSFLPERNGIPTVYLDKTR
ncbi:unnamed protein product [Lasius platythorax]|uniref:Uncharacterized protein n=2 Tax=Lasius platythorax TaxID=488582 RepID=A0AAV2NMR1_9HYME